MQGGLWGRSPLGKTPSGTLYTRSPKNIRHARRPVINKKNILYRYLLFPKYMSVFPKNTKVLIPTNMNISLTFLLL